MTCCGTTPDQPRALERRELARVGARDRERAAEQLGVTGDRAQQRRLAGAVGADQPDDLAGAQLERRVRDDRRAGVADGRGVVGEQHGVARRAHRALPRTSSQMKNGPPSTAVTMPTGISIGAMIVRATRSASTSTIAPPSSDAGSSHR